MNRIYFWIFVVFIFVYVENAKVQPVLKTGYADIGKVKLYYEEMGSGYPVIMLHGGLIDRRMWDDQFELFAEKYRVIRYDARNQGNTKAVADTFYYYEDLHQLMKFLNLKKAVIMGLSLGGRTAIDFAISYPEEVSALILAAPGLHGYDINSEKVVENREKMNNAGRAGDLPGIIEYFQRSWTDGPSRTPDQVDPGVREKVRQMAEFAFSDWTNASRGQFMEPPALGRLNEIKAPTLAVVGDLDMPDILEIVDILEKNVAGAKKVVINDAAHMLNMEKPEEFNKVVLDFLSELGF
ncbi:alpha/beta fold hydrolase [candidate division KSB1 bacterium]